ncbi:hypothetical protein Tco_1122319 [Tanacetum coccineum]|uniref:Uncharacterized protein n=1 Tax=Tanacetum coccineum TaxID=301880 RepID=A0ABQ5J094_9ASTR
MRDEGAFGVYNPRQGCFWVGIAAGTAGGGEGMSCVVGLCANSRGVCVGVVVSPEGPSSSNPIPDSIPKGSGGNHKGQSSSDRSLSGNEDGLTLQSVYDLCVSLCKQVTTQVAQIKDLKAQIKQLKKKAKPVISHHNAWIKSVSMKKRLARKKS